MNNCCGNCIHCKFIDGEWTCTNEESDGYGLETAYDDKCVEWEERDDEVSLP